MHTAEHKPYSDEQIVQSMQEMVESLHTQCAVSENLAFNAFDVSDKNPGYVAMRDLNAKLIEAKNEALRICMELRPPLESVGN